MRYNEYNKTKEVICIDKEYLKIKNEQAIQILDSFLDKPWQDLIKTISREDIKNLRLLQDILDLMYDDIIH